MPGKHGKDKEKDMGAHLDKEKEMGVHDKDKDMGAHDEDKDMRMLKPEVQEKDAADIENYAMQDLFTTAEQAEEKAKEMGLEGSHTHSHMVDGKEIKLYMPGRTHEEYLEAKKKEMGAHEDKEMGAHEDDDKEMGAHEDDKEKDMMDHKKKKDEEEEDMAITANDVHVKKPIGADKYSQDDCDCEEAKDECDCKEEQKNNAVEQTFNLNGVEIFSTGIWNGDKYSQKDLNAMVENFDDVGFEPPIKLGHNEEQPELQDGQPALGYISKIYRVGSKLVADFKELPQKVYDAIKRGNYKRVSSEIYWNYKANGSTFNRVLKAVALLGADIPAVTNLQEIEGLYSNMGTGEIKYHYNGKESEIMEKEHDMISIDEHKDALAELQKEKEEIMKEYQAHKDEIKKDNIASYMDSLKSDGKILPVQYKEVEALLTTATDEKVYSYSKDEKEVNLSQFELVTSILDNMPKVVEFAELSDENGEIVSADYDNAGIEVDRRAKLYVEKKKAENYADALQLVLKDDKELAEKYEVERR